VIAFIMTHAEGSDYNSKNYVYFNTSVNEKFVYIDRIVVEESY